MKKLLVILLVGITVGCTSKNNQSVDQSNFYKTSIAEEEQYYVVVHESGKDPLTRADVIREVVKRANERLIQAGGYKTYDSLAEQILAEDSVSKHNLEKLIENYNVGIYEEIDDKGKYKITLSLGKTR